MDRKMALSSFFACSKASGPQGCQSTGLWACCSRYGLDSWINRLKSGPPSGGSFAISSREGRAWRTAGFSSVWGGVVASWPRPLEGSRRQPRTRAIVLTTRGTRLDECMRIPPGTWSPGHPHPTSPGTWRPEDSLIGTGRAARRRHPSAGIESSMATSDLRARWAPAGSTPGPETLAGRLAGIRKAGSSPRMAAGATGPGA